MPSTSSRSCARSGRGFSEKRGVDYTEQQIQELANVKLEQFLDPKGVRSDLVEQFRRVSDELEPFQPPNLDASMRTRSTRRIAAIPARYRRAA